MTQQSTSFHANAGQSTDGAADNKLLQGLVSAPSCGDPVQRRLVSLRSSRQFFEAALQRGQLMLCLWCNAQK